MILLDIYQLVLLRSLIAIGLLSISRLLSYFISLVNFPIFAERIILTGGTYGASCKAAWCYQ